MTTRGRRDLRQVHAEQTQNLILSAFAECLEENALEDVSVPRLAERAGVSDRTVYRHFPTRVDLIAAFGAWSRENVLPLLPLATLEDLPAVFTEAMRFLDARPQLARALALSEVGREVLTGLTAGVRQLLTDRVEEATPHLSPAERRRVLAALSYLDSAFAWVKLHDDFDMSADEMGEVIGWVMRLVIDAVARGSVGGPGEDR